MRGFVIGMAVAALWAGVPSAAAAQTREGFYFGLGGGIGSATASCDQCDDDDRKNGGAGYVKAGWALNPHVAIGGELNVWAHREDAADGDAWLYMYNASATITLYPSATSGFFVKGGAGVAYLDTDLEVSDRVFELELGRGPGFVAGIGYDIQVGRIAITPALNVWGGRIGEVKARGRGVDVGALSGWTQQVVDLTIGITFP
jgi:hypothetical protein